jgi:hypothetical protein
MLRILSVMKTTLLIFSFIICSSVTSFGQLKFSMDSIFTKQLIKDYCKSEKLDAATQTSLTLYAMKWCKVYGSLTAGNARNGSCATPQECGFAQAELDNNVEKLLGKKGYNKLLDFVFERKQQQFKRK